MFLKLHPKAKIGYKQLTLADLGVGGGNQTHIGLFGETIDFISDFHQQSFAQFIYEDKSKELLSFLDPIQNPDGTFRSPKIRSGNEAELNMLGTRINSVVKEIREIVQKEPDKKWYLLWFGLESEDLVFFLLKEGSVNFSEITQILGELQSRGVIENNNKNFKDVIQYLNHKINDLNIGYIEELEVIAQTGAGQSSNRMMPRRFDIEKAKKLFEEIGRKGEILINEYLEKLKKEGEIKKFEWMNQKNESGMPYDFEITNVDNQLFFSDVKSTSYKFEQDMIFSGRELKFINENNNYLIHRVYNLNEDPKLKICKNINKITPEFVEDYGKFDISIQTNGLKVNSIKIEVPPILKRLEFNSEIILK